MTDDAETPKTFAANRVSDELTISLDARPALATNDLARYAAAAAAADDPELVFGPAERTFRHIRPLLLSGDRRAADGAGLIVQNLCLQLCLSEATSAKRADDKCGFLDVLTRWAWPRAPAVAAVLEKSRAFERERWGPSSEGRA